MKPEQPLEYISSKFFVETCVGKQKLFSELTPWELLNLKPNDILDIPDRLYQEHGRFLGNFLYRIPFELELTTVYSLKEYPTHFCPL